MLKKITKNKTFIIAEAGVNHNGSIEMAKKLIMAAKEAGADAVKFQTWKTDKIIVPGTEKAEYQKRHVKGNDQYKMLKSLELSYADFDLLNRYAKKIGILFLSTPDEEESLDFLAKKIRVPIIKVASPEITNLPFLKIIASYKKPIILSTGMAILSEVKRAVRVIEKEWAHPQLAVLHCTSAYPCPPEEANLRVITAYLKKFPDYIIGYSDHTEGFWASCVAVALGARIIEKHFTLDNNLSGPDHRASLNVADFKMLVNQIRLVEKGLGSSEKIPTPSEISNKRVIQKFIVAADDILKDDIIALNMIAAKRTSATGGLTPDKLNLILNKKARRALKKNEIIKKSDVY